MTTRSQTSKTLLVKNADVLVTMDAGRREIARGGLYVEDNRIVAVGTSDTLPATADEVLDLSGHVVIPGLVNTHHHMYQSLTRAIPAAQDGELFNWLTNLYPVWANLTPEMIRVSTQTAMAELLLSGCTTSSDHLYIYPNGCKLDDSIEAAAEIGMRFHASRGSMSVGQSQGGLPPDRVVEREADILADTQRLIETYHDAGRYAMLRVVVAPCSPFSVSRDLMRESAAMARHYGVSLHTHLAENVNDIAYSREKFGMTPAEYAQDLGWVGHDVWHAHCVQLDDAGIALFAKTGTGVAHCPCSNMRLASGIAPIRRMRDAGVPVGLGVDGSASNDAGHMINEARQALLLQRVGFGPNAMTAREALEIATVGGARVLGRDDIGVLAAGMAADFVAFDTRGVGMAGGLHDPVAALVFCNPGQAAYSVVNGRVVVREGRLTTLDLPSLVTRHNALARQLAEASR
ncbi:8-oxoguanine deaminase [Pandoraea nosoerga]|uniref:8-oxoguanine deaminase n=1 Tax=Pandoraea nosoerga TaxID=2508296 RepID=A0A5E4Y0I7_9BURK|nr:MULTISPECIES: 8-oxoguanine deaminase [Pandoraea]MBN4666500.1 8-oxoguanine deaminase [Pandoraea nosoerga]MBN4677525.1 8-oxoguanine deaminase [Pandoraea nosoerga]MBN4682345.1 8-oxoguanine deaminase [Pandoraea nosoerga]MBN4745660.1 8-oxoguanine deaminase [Pandoraea nosoerga]VVE42136.1 8-oxoguanine deaminase [Pandoraea nosoerga]